MKKNKFGLFGTSKLKSTLDYRLSNVVLGNIERAIQQGHISNLEELADTLNGCRETLLATYYELAEALEVRKDCVHEYGQVTHTMRERLFGSSIKVFERTCKKCSYKEGFEVDLDGYTQAELPEWCIAT